tara:strand:+ start:1960 stop:2475 length:516 start_codon:yes stop_codon:yes gene_type:complete
MTSVVGQVIVGLALTAVSSYLQTRQAQDNKKKKDSILAAQTRIQEKQLYQDRIMRLGARQQATRLAKAKQLNTMGSRNLDIPSSQTAANVIQGQESMLEGWTANLDESYKDALAMAKARQEYAAADEVQPLSSALLGGVADVAGGIVIEDAMDSARGKDGWGITKFLNDNA